MGAAGAGAELQELSLLSMVGVGDTELNQGGASRLDGNLPEGAGSCRWKAEPNRGGRALRNRLGKGKQPLRIKV